MIFNFDNAKYDIQITFRLKVITKKIRRHGKDINKLISVLEKITNGEELDKQYKKNNELVLLLFATGSYSGLFSR